MVASIQTMAKMCFIDQSGQLGGAELMLLDMIPQMDVEAKVLLLQDGPFREALVAQRIEVQVVGRPGSAHAQVSRKAGFFTLLRSLPTVLGIAFRLSREMRGMDIAYANTPKAWLMGALAAWWSGVPLICHLHDIVSARHFSALNRRLLIQTANRVASAVITNSAASARAFVDAGGNEALVTVIPNGFKLESFCTHVEGMPRILREERLIGEAKMVVMVGRLAPWKGQHVFIKALATLPGVHGVIVGEALFTAEDRAYAASLPDLALTLGCAERVHFLGFLKDVVPVLREADIVVHCSVEPEPFGRVIVEAMLCGRPVVVAGEGGAAEIVEPKVTGLHHVPGDASSLASCLRQLLEQPAFAKDMAQAGVSVAREKYSLHQVMRQTMDVLTIVLREKTIRATE